MKGHLMLSGRVGDNLTLGTRIAPYLTLEIKMTDALVFPASQPKTPPKSTTSRRISETL
jgi:hypothetical protein